MNYWAADIPLPGSDNAARRGCRCPRLDNGYGRWYVRDGVWVVNEDCPLHGRPGQPEPQPQPEPPTQ